MRALAFALRLTASHRTGEFQERMPELPAVLITLERRGPIHSLDGKALADRAEAGLTEAAAEDEPSILLVEYKPYPAA